jgi:serine/threonine-protein kinase
VGQTIAERYTVRALAGEGSLARVYRAYDTINGTRVALKRLKTPDLTARFLLRFRAATYAAALLTHPRLVAVTDYALVDREAVVVMEWAPHQTLATYLARRSRVRPVVAGQIALWLAETLAVIHAHSLLHLDLTPRNIFLDEVVGVRVADIGLARAISDTGLTVTGDGFLHTLPFLAPEQLAYGELSPATDVFALGVVLFRTLTGRYPFPSASLAERLAAHKDHANQPPPRPSNFVRNVPAALDAAIAAALHYRPELRPADGTVLLQRLQKGLVDSSETTLTVIVRATTHIRPTSAKHRAVKGKRHAKDTPKS